MLCIVLYSPFKNLLKIVAGSWSNLKIFTAGMKIGDSHQPMLRVKSSVGNAIQAWTA